MKSKYIYIWYCCVKREFLIKPLFLFFSAKEVKAESPPGSRSQHAVLPRMRLSPTPEHQEGFSGTGLTGHKIPFATLATAEGLQPICFYVLNSALYFRMAELEALFSQRPGHIISVTRSLLKPKEVLEELYSSDVFVLARALVASSKLIAGDHHLSFSSLASLTREDLLGGTRQIPTFPGLNIVDRITETPFSTVVKRLAVSPSSRNGSPDGPKRQLSEEEESQRQTRARKRLSIDTALTEKTNDNRVLEQTMRVKQQQQAIIDARSGTHHVRSNSRENPLNDLQTAATSPRGDFPNSRDLPFPRSAAPRSSLSSGKPVIASAPVHGSHKATSTPIVPTLVPRSAFVATFEAMYDQMEAQARMQAALKDQIRKSTALFQTLQSSGQMIEGLVRSHFREMQHQYGEKFGAALTDLNRRLSHVETKLGIPPPSSQPPSARKDQSLPSASINTGAATAGTSAHDAAVLHQMESLMKRVESIEKMAVPK